MQLPAGNCTFAVQRVPYVFLSAALQAADSRASAFRARKEKVILTGQNAFPDSCKLYCKADTQTADELRENGGNNEDYEKKLEVVEGLFKSEPNRKKTGGEYMLDQAMGEIGSIQKPAEKPEIGKVNKAPDLEKKGSGIQ